MLKTLIITMMTMHGASCMMHDDDNDDNDNAGNDYNDDHNNHDDQDVDMLITKQMMVVMMHDDA